MESLQKWSKKVCVNGYLLSVGFGKTESGKIVDIKGELYKKLLQEAALSGSIDDIKKEKEC